MFKHTIKKYGGLKALLLFILIYISQDTLLFGTNSNQLFCSIGQYILIFASFAMFVYMLIKRIGIPQKGFLLCIILIIMIWLTCVFNQELYTNYIYKTFLLICAMLYTAICSREKFIEYFTNIVFIISVFSIFIYLLFLISPTLINYFPKMFNSAGAEYKFGFLSFAPLKVYTFNPRAMGIFREAGVYSIFLCIAIYFELFEKKTISIVKNIVYLIALITTFSTTGYIVLLLIVVCRISKKVGDKSKKRKINYILFSLLFASLIISQFTDLLSIDGDLFGKFFANSATYSSGTARISSIFTNLRMFWSNPLFGVGAYGVDTNFADLSWQFYSFNTVHNTNSFLMNYSSYGFIYGSTILILWYRFFAKNQGIMVGIELLVTFFLLLSGETLIHNVIFYIIAFYGLNNIEKTEFIPSVRRGSKESVYGNRIN